MRGRISSRDPRHDRMQEQAAGLGPAGCGKTSQVTATTSQILVTRPAVGYRDRGRRYRIEVDDEEVGQIGPGEQLSISSSPGRHVVQARIDWSGSPRLIVNVAEGGSSHLVVRPAGNAAMALFQGFGRTSWLRLEAG
jgi:hypothetical protein